MAASATFAEDELGRKWDRCLTDVVLKTDLQNQNNHTVECSFPHLCCQSHGGGGLLVGTVLTVLFFKRRSWPVVLGAGFGIGSAYTNCERDLNSIIQDGTSKPSKAKK